MTSGNIDRQSAYADFPSQGEGYFRTPEGITFDFGTTVPTDATEGYAPGCHFIHTDGSGEADLHYVNFGTKASCNFDPVDFNITENAYLSGVTPGTGAVSKALVLDSSGDLVYPNAGTLTIGNIDTAVEAAEHGAGAIGTYAAPATYRYKMNGTIITEIKIDLTGLAVSGTENDVVGLAAGGAAYIGRNVVATNGIFYKVEVSCLEVPTGGSADILFVAGSAADEAYNDTVANTQTIADGTGDWTLGETIVNTAPAAIAANYYFYMTQGDTDSGTYTAGQFLLRFYGHAAL